MHNLCKLCKFGLFLKQFRLLHIRDDYSNYPCLSGYSRDLSKYNGRHSDFNWSYNSPWRIRNDDEELRWLILNRATFKRCFKNRVVLYFNFGIQRSIYCPCLTNLSKRAFFDCSHQMHESGRLLLVSLKRHPILRWTNQTAHYSCVRNLSQCLRRYYNRFFGFNWSKHAYSRFCHNYEEREQFVSNRSQLKRHDNPSRPSLLIWCNFHIFWCLESNSTIKLSIQRYLLLVSFFDCHACHSDD